VSRTQWRNPYSGIDYQTVTEESSSTDSASGTSLPDDKQSTNPANSNFQPSPSNLSRNSCCQHQEHRQLEAATGNLDVSSVSVSRYSITDIESSLKKDSEDDKQEHGRSYVIPPSPPAPPGTPVLGCHPANGSDIVSVRINSSHPGNFYVIQDEQVANYTTFGKEAKSDVAARARNMSTLSQGSWSSSPTLCAPPPESLKSISVIKSLLQQQKCASKRHYSSLSPFETYPRRHQSTTESETVAAKLKEAVPLRKHSLTRSKSTQDLNSPFEQDITDAARSIPPLSPLVTLTQRHSCENLNSIQRLVRDDAIIYAQPDLQHLKQNHQGEDDKKLDENVHNKCKELVEGSQEEDLDNLDCMPSVAVRRAALQIKLNTQVLLPRNFQKPRESWHKDASPNKLMSFSPGMVPLPGLSNNTKIISPITSSRK